MKLNFTPKFWDYFRALKPKSPIVSEGFSGRNQKFKRFFRPKTGDLKKKRSSSQTCHEIQCQFTKITKIPVANTNLGLNLHSSSPKPVNFFGAQSLLGGAQFPFEGSQAVIWGGARPRNAPPWRRA